jgi:hypothetical protein
MFFSYLPSLALRFVCVQPQPGLAALRVPLRLPVQGRPWMACPLGGTNVRDISASPTAGYSAARTHVKCVCDNSAGSRIGQGSEATLALRAKHAEASPRDGASNTPPHPSAIFCLIVTGLFPRRLPGAHDATFRDGMR